MNESPTPQPITAPRSNVIPADRVRRASHAALVDTGPHTGGLTVVPIVEAGRVAGFEIRCRCGCHAFVECLPAEEPRS